ncbi:hypothetical protein B0J13DRAFT_526244 [Dactylonectria estremocensis]|uniref:non-specific serine/threonine protein kinase n=1 Tax=Dactylonectria estremocensis TaxID=1079267 RepID=A0A9P9J432_9HYPO|nr:hypothetical protein B0J13DRAFT_526244 [Dactylonectria estremocensis]
MPSAVTSPPGAIEATTSGPIYNSTVDDRGDFVDSEYEAYIEELVENTNLYPEGLLYPICIGEIVANRYRIDDKLGHGSFSTVWMAYDTARKMDVALEIMMLGESAKREYRMQDEIVRTVPDITHLLTYNDIFFLHSPHGDHRVLVFPLQGPNFQDYPRKDQLPPCLHDGGIVHRDPSSANVIYSLRPLDNWSTAAKYEYLGRHQNMRLFTKQWREGELIMPMESHESLLARLFHGSGYTSVVSCMVNTVGPHPVSWRYSYHASGSCDTTWYNQDRQPDPAMALKAKIIKLRPGIGLMELELVMSILRPGDSRIY